jgi:hypothetical protein
LGKETSEAVASILLRTLRDREDCVRLAAAQVLGKRDEPQFVPYFLKLLEDAHFEVRLVAVQFLGRFYSTQISEALVIALTDEERAIRQVSETTLNAIAPDWAQSQAAQRAGVRLEALLENRPAWVRSAIQQVLTKVRTAAGGVVVEGVPPA